MVLDEAHTYKGAFGAHVSCVMRRLLRLHSIYSNHLNPSPPQFICCSATMENTEEHFSALLPLEECLGGRKNLCCVLSKDDTAPKGGKTLILWRPPIITTTTNVSQNMLELSSPRPTAADSIVNAATKFLKKKLIFPSSEESSNNTSQYNYDDMLESSYDGGGIVVQYSGGGVTNLKQQHPTTQMVTSEVVENDLIPQENNSVGEGGGVSIANVKLGATEEDTTVSYLKNTAKENGESDEFARRTSPVLEISMIFSALVKQRIRTLAFCRTRKLTELVLQVWWWGHLQYIVYIVVVVVPQGYYY